MVCAVNGVAAGAGANVALGDFASQALWQALSQQGGFGMAKSILRDLSHSGNKAESGKVTGNLHGNSTIRTFK